MLQETVAGFEVRCCASQLLYQARRGVHSCVQAAAAARVAGGPDIWNSAKNGDGYSVLCHLIADARSVNRRKNEFTYGYLPPPLLLLLLFLWSKFLLCKFILLLSFSQYSPLLYSAREGHLDICRLLLQCNANMEYKDNE